MSDVNMNELYRRVANDFIDWMCEVDGVKSTIRFLMGEDGEDITDDELLALHFDEDDIKAVREDLND